MLVAEPYLPQAVFAPEGAPRPRPRVLIGPGRYIQGPGVLDDLGRYLALLPGRRAALLVSDGSRRRLGARLASALSEQGIRHRFIEFTGECSVAEVERIAGELRNTDGAIDTLVAVGGGKALDTGKCVAHRLRVPLAACATIASTDAPCSALSVMYTEEGVFEGVEYFPDSPAIVLVDSQVVAEAPLRYLVAGMGDAVATWYEARTCAASPLAVSTLGGRTTVAAAAIAEACARTVFENGLEALEAARSGVVTEALERVVEANTLLSGIGFESGGLAAAHAVASVLPSLPQVRRESLHGEMVAIGVLTQLCLESDGEEADRVGRLFAGLGLPVQLGHVGIDPAADGAALSQAAAMAAGLPFAHNEPVPVTAESLMKAVTDAHRLGLELTAEVGDAPYRSLRGATREAS